MRWSLAALVAALLSIGMLASDASPAAAENPAGDGAFCIRGFTYGGAGGLGDCSFSSYAQCQASSVGRAAYCNANPYYKANTETRSVPGRVSRRRH